jgi:glycosyltransferase involved in cell wall biosynthesis
MTTPRVCYLGAYDPAYPRNLILRRGLAQCGVPLVECAAPREQNTAARMRALRRAFEPVKDDCDLIVLAEFGQALAPLAWDLARRHRKKLVIDAFTPTYDSAVYDRGVARPRSPAALRYWLVDWLALRLAGRVLADTAAHRDYYAGAFGIRPDKVAVIPVGASDEWFKAAPRPHDSPEVLVQFYGSYIPLHGVEVILEAAHLLTAQAEVRFELIGRGQTYAEMRALAHDLDLQNVTFCEPVPPEALPAQVARADLSLGIFGTTPKASRVVPYKVYQTLALGKPLISADTPALREAFHPGEHLLAVPPGDPEALAEAILALALDPERGRRLGEAGRARMEAEFSEAALGRRLLDAIS